MKKISWAAIAVTVWIMGFSALSPFSPPVSAQATFVVDDDGQGSTSDCDSTDTAYSTIQAAIDAAAADDTILVCPGTYDQDEANGRDPDTGGTGSNDFNIFVGKPLTIRGVDSSGTPIDDYDNVAAFVEAKRKLPTFGESTIFVQADGVTISGLDITGWLDGDYNNKTLEVVGDDFTLRDCALHALDTASSLYFDDRHFNAGTMTSHVQSYHVEENLLDGGGPDADGIRISSGAGWSGPVSGRVIADNTFDNTIDGIAFVGPGGDPWDVYPVGAATITGNSFSRSDRRHVVAWGSYSGGPGYGDIDWQGIVDNNTFDKGAVTWTPGGDARAWTSGSFIDVRGIYSAIQRYAINKAVAGDTVQVLPGVYNERLTISKSLDLRGAQYGVDPTQPGARTDPAAESVVDLTGLAITNPNVLVEISDGVSDVSVAGFTLIGSPTFHYADEAVIRAWDNNIAIGDNIINGYIDLLYKGPGQGLDVLRNRMTFNKNGAIIQPGTANNVDVSDNVLALGASPAGDEAAIYMTGVTQGTVTGNTAKNVAPNGRGLYGSNLTQLTASGNTFTGNKDAISIFGSSTFITINDNDLSNSLRFGVNIKGQDITISDNEIKNSGDVGVNVDKHVLNTERVTITGNNISGNTNYGVKVNTALVTAIVDARDNWWGSANGPRHVTNTFNVGAQGDVVSDGVAFTSWLDAPAPGGASFAPVTTTSPAGSYSSIQAGINASNAGGTVNAKAGTYTENLNVASRSDINVVGAGRVTTIVKPAATSSWAIPGMPQYDSRKAAVRVYGSTDIDFSDFTFDFDLVKGNNVAGLLYWDSTGIISDNALKNMTASDAAGFYGELTSYVRAPSYSDGARAEVQFSGNIFTETGRLGIVTHDFVHATIQGNTFTKTINDFGYAMEIGSRSTATISGNTISGYDTPAASDGSTSAGIYIENSFTGGLPHINKPVIVSDNEVTGNQYGVWIGNEYTGYAGDIDVNVTLQGNTISANTDGGVYIVDEGRSAGSSVTVNASGNDVTNNGDVGYWFNTYGDGELHVDVRNDTITGHGWGAVMTDYPSGTSNSLYDVSVNLSDLSGNTVGAENAVVGVTLDTTGDWWGNASGPYNAANNADGTGVPISDDIAYSPWLEGGTDTSSDPGFQPASPKTFIAEPQVCLPGACIQQGVDLATAGDTILVHEGTYTENTNIDKTLSLLAASRPVLDGGAAGNVISVTADGIVIDGFEIRNGYTGIELQDVSDAVISDNEIHHNQNIPGYAGAGIVFWGDSDDNAITGNSIHDNDRQGLFIGHDSGTLISERNLISENWIYDNGLNEVGLPDASRYGIQLWNADDNRIEKNEVYSHTKTSGWWFAVGVYLCGAANTTVYANDLHDNEYNIGIYDCGGSSAGNSIVANDITDAGNTGIRVWSNAATTVARLNRITGNSSYGVNNTDTTGSVDAKSNWWGNLTGPYHATKNPAGLGDRVSDYVLFDPWIKGIEYVGDRSVPLGSIANLRARFLNSDNTSPAVAGVQVYFDLLDSHSTPVSGSPFSAVTQSNGVASVGVPGLGVDVYTVVSRWDPLQDSDLLGVFGPGDSDGDGILDVLDNCPVVPNPDQLNTDGGPLDNGPNVPGNDLTNPSGDGYGDVCDDDDDNDWLTDAFESVGCGSGPINPLLQDTDGDRVIDGAECLLGSDPKNPASKPPLVPTGDADGDGLTTSVEAMFASSDADKDSEDDGFSDGEEVKGWATLPAKLDADSDGCYDWIEIASINDDTQANILDVMQVTKAALGLMPSHKAFDMDRNGSVNLLDAMRAALNSTLVRAHNPCS